MNVFISDKDTAKLTVQFAQFLVYLKVTMEPCRSLIMSVKLY